jgi:hypothetical protein
LSGADYARGQSVDLSAATSAHFCMPLLLASPGTLRVWATSKKDIFLKRLLTFAN